MVIGTDNYYTCCKKATGIILNHEDNKIDEYLNKIKNNNIYEIYCIQ